MLMRGGEILLQVRRSQWPCSFFFSSVCSVNTQWPPAVTTTFALGQHADMHVILRVFIAMLTDVHKIKQTSDGITLVRACVQWVASN